MEELIIIKQLPVIEETLKAISKEIDEKVFKANALVCNEDSVKEVKSLRANFNKDFKELEEQRKAVKEKVLAPYIAFEEVYKTYITDKYKSADATLKSKVDIVENELKAKKYAEVRDYFTEYSVSMNVDFITFEQAKINVTLTASMKSLKDQAKTFIDKVVDDLALIDTQEQKTEILVEYKQTLNVAAAITNVSKRYKAIEEEKARQETLAKAKEQEQQRVEELTEMVMNAPVEEFTAPVIEEAPAEVKQEVYTMTFKVTGTLDQLKVLKGYMESEGINYGTI